MSIYTHTYSQTYIHFCESTFFVETDCARLGSGQHAQSSGSGRHIGEPVPSIRKRLSPGSDYGEDEGSSLCTDTSDGGKELSGGKRPRMIWTDELKKLFDEVVNELVRSRLPLSTRQLVNHGLRNMYVLNKKLSCQCKVSGLTDVFVRMLWHIHGSGI